MSWGSPTTAGKNRQKKKAEESEGKVAKPRGGKDPMRIEQQKEKVINVQTKKGRGLG